MTVEGDVVYAHSVCDLIPDEFVNKEGSKSALVCRQSSDAFLTLENVCG